MQTCQEMRKLDHLPRLARQFIQQGRPFDSFINQPFPVIHSYLFINFRNWQLCILNVLTGTYFCVYPFLGDGWKEKLEDFAVHDGHVIHELRRMTQAVRTADLQRLPDARHAERLARGVGHAVPRSRPACGTAGARRRSRRGSRREEDPSGVVRAASPRAQAQKHTGLGLLTPADVHFGRAPAILEQRQRVLSAAYACHPERFVKGLPKPLEVPTAVWINPPAKKEGS